MKTGTKLLMILIPNVLTFAGGYLALTVLYYCIDMSWQIAGLHTVLVIGTYIVPPLTVLLITLQVLIALGVFPPKEVVKS